MRLIASAKRGATDSWVNLGMRFAMGRWIELVTTTSLIGLACRISGALVEKTGCEQQA